MQLKITTDYAIRSLLYLAQEGECVNCAQIADATQIPRGYLQKLLIDLKNAGIVETYQGGNGGYALTRPPEQICLAEILEIFERSTRVNVCLESEYNGPCKEDCPIRKFCEGIQNVLDYYMENTSLADLLKEDYAFDYDAPRLFDRYYTEHAMRQRKMGMRPSILNQSEQRTPQ